jgi:hypothetical protein
MSVPIIVAVALVIAVPWHVLAMMRNPPLFAFSMHSGPGEYRGFFWFYFFNEHLLRFLNLRYPRDYNTVPRGLFWALNLVWLFPWSAYLAGAVKLSYGRATRAARVHLMALCWIGVVMLFFTFSTTQEYYSMPIYPALALLIGSALAEKRFFKAGSWILLSVFAVVFAALATVLLLVAKITPQGELVDALTQHPDLYTLSLGHMADLTLAAFAFMKAPLALAAFAFGFCLVAGWFSRHSAEKMAVVLCVGMIIFFQAARIALIRFDPYMGSYPIAQRLLASPPGDLIEADAYYAFSSVFFYTDRTALLLNGRNNNLEYGSYAPNSPAVFIGDSEFSKLWQTPKRYYLLINAPDLPHIDDVVGKDRIIVVQESSGKYLLSNLQ